MVFFTVPLHLLLTGCVHYVGEMFVRVPLNHPTRKFHLFDTIVHNDVNSNRFLLHKCCVPIFTINLCMNFNIAILSLHVL